MQHMRIIDFDGESTLTLDCSTPVDQVIIDAGHEPNGFFWEGVAQLVGDDLMDLVEFDSEGSMFAADGDRLDLEQLQDRMEPVIAEPQAMRELLAEAKAEGFEFED